MRPYPTLLLAAVATLVVSLAPGASSMDSPARPSEAKESMGQHAWRPSIEDMLARERKYTYPVNMSNPSAWQRKQSVDSWRDECAAKKIENPKVGWVKDRSHFCNHYEATLHFDPDKPAELAISFDWLVYATGSVGAGSERKLTFVSELRNLRSTGVIGWPADEPISLGAGCNVLIPLPEPLGQCILSGLRDGIVEHRTLAEWQANPIRTITVRSQDNWTSKNNAEKVTIMGFSPEVAVRYSSIQRSATSFAVYTRFDSASYLSTPKGAIFRGYVPHLVYDPNDETSVVKEVAEHIRLACDPATVNTTFPPAGGPKHIPGCRIDDLIHRITQAKDGEPVKDAHKNRHRANSNAKTRNCRKCPPATSSSGAKQCDEFPFASTYEGSAASEYPPTEFAGTEGLGKINQFSIRKVNSTHNSTAGGLLEAWYSRDRILDWSANGTSTTSADGTMRDGFWVLILPT